MEYVEINYLAVLVAPVLTMIIGSVWYAPKGFGNAWMQQVGLKKADIDKMSKDVMMKAYGGSVVASWLMALILAYFLGFMGASSIAEGMQVAFWAWLGFTAAAALPHYLFAHWSYRLFLINTLYSLTSLLAMSVLLMVWT